MAEKQPTSSVCGPKIHYTLSAECLEYLSYFKTPAGLADIHWPSEAEVAKARLKKKISQNSQKNS